MVIQVVIYEEGCTSFKTQTTISRVFFFKLFELEGQTKNNLKSLYEMSTLYNLLLAQSELFPRAVSIFDQFLKPFFSPIFDCTPPPPSFEGGDKTIKCFSNTLSCHSCWKAILNMFECLKRKVPTFNQILKAKASLRE